VSYRVRFEGAALVQLNGIPSPAFDAVLQRAVNSPRSPGMRPSCRRGRIGVLSSNGGRVDLERVRFCALRSGRLIGCHRSDRPEDVLDGRGGLPEVKWGAGCAGCGGCRCSPGQVMLCPAGDEILPVVGACAVGANMGGAGAGMVDDPIGRAESLIAASAFAGLAGRGAAGA
jgi:hypothetical protein